jgi:hypothetical protein
MALKRYTQLTRKTRLAAKSAGDSAVLKEQIQALVRAIVIIRDGGCILRAYGDRYRDFPQCNGYTKADELILQADHLVTRANSATYADIRLIVCLCTGHHAWKSKGGNARKAEYDEIVKTLIEPERVALWEACERDSWKPHRTYASDWQKEVAFLKTKLRALDPAHPLAA